MKTIAIASGKGGTGKTSLAISLLQANMDRSRLLDCDVEEPNCHLFLHTHSVSKLIVNKLIPKINEDLCRLCGKCVKACQFNALALAGKSGILVFEELCHSCGGCARICPAGAITEVPVRIGEVVQSQMDEGMELTTGTLVVGHSTAPTVIKAVKNSAAIRPVLFTLIDAPPGTSCSFVAAVEKTDFVILVTEATPFGLNDLKLAIEALEILKLPFAVVINRSQNEENLVKEFCDQRGFRILMQIPESRRVAEFYAQGKSLLEAMPEYKEPLRRLLERCVA